jgi:transcriptional regulator with XRE-family HTH domain
VNERIKKLRKTLDLTQQEFADKIGVKQNTVAQYEMGRNIPIDSVIFLICREFNVNEEWLRNGTGEMFLPTDRNADIARLTKQLLDEESDSFKNRLISILSNLSVEEWQYLEKRAKELCGIDDLHNSK